MLKKKLMNRNKKMKKYLSVMCVALLMLLCACNGGGTAENTEEAAEKKETVSMFDLKTAMLAADDTFPEMLYVSDSDSNAEDLFHYISEDFDYSKIEHFFLAYSSDSSNPSGEVVVIALKDSADAEEAMSELKKHVEHRVKMYTEYDPDSVSKVQGADVFSNRQYVVLIISEKQGKVKAAFEEFIK